MERVVGFSPAAMSLGTIQKPPNSARSMEERFLRRKNATQALNILHSLPLSGASGTSYLCINFIKAWRVGLPY